MEGIKISYKELYDSAEQINNVATKVDAILKDATEKMGLVNEYWKSEASSQKIDEFKRLSNLFSVFYEELKNYAQNLKQTADAYQEVDKTINEVIEIIE